MDTYSTSVCKLILLYTINKTCHDIRNEFLLLIIRYFSNQSVIINIILQHYVMEVPRNTAVGIQVGCVLATDKDSGRNATITYNIAGHAGYFTMQPDTGCVAVSRPLDVCTVQCVYSAVCVLYSVCTVQCVYCTVCVQCM